MTDEIELDFEDPPDQVLLRSRAQGARYIDFAIALRSHKDKWAVLPATPGSKAAAQGLAQNIRRGVTKAFGPKGAYEAVTDGEKVWVRYVANRSDEDTASVPSRPASSSRGSDAGDDDETSPAKDLTPKIRAWAMEKGMEVGEKGRLPRAVIDAYFNNHPEEERPAHLRAV